MQLHIYKDADAVCETLAAWIVQLINKTLEVKEKFTWALSGGETPKKLYQLLASDQFSIKINWSRIHIFWGDERVVPFSDERGNARMAFDNLLDHVKVPSSQIHKIWTDIQPQDAAKNYEKLLHVFFDDKQSTFDLALIGMGDDGHTLSLFPNSEILNDDIGWVMTENKKQKGMKRITLMPSVINKSAAVVFLVTGEKKAKILQEVITNPSSKKYPAQLIQPSNGELHWFIDTEAAKYL
jgi:6-phosphogluconolactonase